jgi:hypothetical protein
MNIIGILEQILSTTVSGIIINLPWFVLIYLGFKMISREIKAGVKEIPNWITQYEKIKNKEKILSWAKGK